MTTYIATFADGTTETREDSREFGFAWRLVFADGFITGGNGCGKVGFAKDAVCAEKAAKSLLGFINGNRKAEFQRKRPGKRYTPEACEIQIVPCFAE